MFVPRCPTCGESKIMLTPILREFVPPAEKEALRVGCGECGWKGILEEVVWDRV